ncbi:MAG: transporter ATP-binding protein [Planctomycetaceae bacterium]|nr:transporter ATP-binding protein [Planctomycetaceae bacterium]
MSASAPAISVQDVRFAYGERQALNGLTFDVKDGEIFGLLGPNGGGKSTLFRILSTLLPLQQGAAQVGGFDLASQQAMVRQILGVTFQSPSLDRKLTVQENLKHQGHLYGLRGADLQSRIGLGLERLGVADRRRELVSKLSGGLQRRVEIAKSLLHRPRLLLLDEPSTGLDPGARIELWKYLRELRQEMALTIVVTTHLLDEAEDCDRLGILHEGQMVALDTPDALRSSVGGDCLTIRSREPERLAVDITAQFGVTVHRVGDQLRIEREGGHDLLRDVVSQFGTAITSVTLGKPTLEDVFVQRTGKQFW